MKLILSAIAATTLVSPFAAGGEAARTFEVLGVVKKLKPDIRTVVIDHEEIPGYMDAMTMSLEVLELKELDGIKAGDKIAFRMNVTEDDGWIDRLKVVEAAKTTTPVSSEAPLLKQIQPGELFPDANLIDHEGKPFKLSDYKGRTFAVTFIYTLCPFPTFCPRVNSHFRETQALLKKAATSTESVNLLSITIDPARDTPEVLGAFARTQEADPSRWKFATGTLADITKLAVQSGLDFWDDRGVIQHNLRTIVIDETGRVKKVFAEDELNSVALATELTTPPVAETCNCSSKEP